MQYGIKHAARIAHEEEQAAQIAHQGSLHLGGKNEVAVVPPDGEQHEGAAAAARGQARWTRQRTKPRSRGFVPDTCWANRTIWSRGRRWRRARPWSGRPRTPTCVWRGMSSRSRSRAAAAARCEVQRMQERRTEAGRIKKDTRILNARSRLGAVSAARGCGRADEHGRARPCTHARGSGEPRCSRRMGKRLRRRLFGREYTWSSPLRRSSLTMSSSFCSRRSEEGVSARPRSMGARGRGRPAP